jgi:hypothetical protein
MRSSFPAREFTLPIEKIDTTAGPRAKENSFVMRTEWIPEMEQRIFNIRDRYERNKAGAVANAQSKVKLEELIASKQAAGEGIKKSALAQGIKNKRLLALERELENLNYELAYHTKRIACCIAVRDGAALQDKNFEHKLLADLKALKLLEDE